jgi:ribosomal protein L3 glutamine methyltransferase
MDSETPGSTVTLADAVAHVERRLRDADLDYGHGTDNARDEAAWLVLAAAGLSPVEPADPARTLAPEEWQSVEQLLERRVVERRPLAYLTGSAWFAGLEFAVNEHALVPRSPIAEPIAERFAPWLPDHPIERILEIGTGSGCIAVACAMAFPEARIDATDIDDRALALARRNIERHGTDERIELHAADVYRGLPAGRRYDLVVSNPPYVDADGMAALSPEYRHEPPGALVAGRDGLDVIARIIDGAADRLTADGLLVVETGRDVTALEQRYPRTPFLWLALSTPEVGIFALPARDLPSAG